ncbi:MAG: hypothetical protein CVU65_05555 [Deltaproteobacteria bacterium HGW-Deltaproteobacteria-22]|nr:MAG: hypothetical protein CVU65_05555 [Deltaproteobacteria bacterium HGW-Deltaproteobacteria-22]
MLWALVLSQATAMPQRPGPPGPLPPPGSAPPPQAGPLPPGAMKPPGLRMLPAGVMLPPGAMLPPPGTPPHVKPGTGAVSPEPGGSVLLTQPPQGDRVIPSCEHKSNPGDVLRLESVAIFLTIGKENLRLTRKLTFSPTTAWKPLCDHKFFLGEPDTVWTANARTQVWFTQPPRPRQAVEPATRLPGGEFRSFGTGSGPPEPPTTPALSGANLTLAPFPGNPTDHRFILEIEQECVVFPEPGEDGLTSLNLPLKHLIGYTPAKTLMISVQMEFNDGWFFHGATMPESGQLDHKVNWEFPGVPDQDLKILFSGEAPVEADPEATPPAESTSDKFVRVLLLVAVLFVVLGVLLFGMRFRNKARKTGK